jgi:hypothetical protein
MFFLQMTLADIFRPYFPIYTSYKYPENKMQRSCANTFKKYPFPQERVQIFHLSRKNEKNDKQVENLK